MSANKVQIYVLILFIIPAVLGYPQFISFGKDGKVGVNFGGYHAEAGLGGLLTGNAAHGGLSASAGTPYGQNAGAGLGGTVDGRTAGGLFAGATAGHGVGASAALAGSIGAEGGAGGSIAESHAAGIQKTVVKLEETAPPVLAVNSQTTIHHEQPSFTVSKAVVGSVGVDSVPQDAGETVVYHKIKTKKKFNTAPVIQPVVQQDTVIAPPQQQTITTVQVPQYYQQQPSYDYRKFLDFGFFANTGAQFGGAGQVQTQQVPTVVAVPTVVTKHHHHHHHHRRLKPAKRIQYVQTVQQAPPPPPPVATVNIEKRVYAPPPPTFHVHKTFQAAAPLPVTTTTVQKQPVVITRPVSSEESSESLSSDSLESHEYGSKSKTKIVSYSHGAGVSAHAHAGGGTFFDGIFNIPIATLTAVNQFLNGKAAAAGGGGGIGYHKSVTITG
ncbi:hypothetical protein DMENIID0001_101050 [Sergentomyia squamirostris]